MSVETFGPEAQTYGAALGELDALVADASDAARALAAAARLKREGRAFLSGVLLDDPRAAVAYDIAAQMLATASTTDEDGLRRLFDGLASQVLAINGNPQTVMHPVPPAVARVLHDVSMMGDGQLVRSWEEARRLGELFGRRRDFVVRVPPVDPRVPRAAFRGSGEGILVWAAGMLPHRTAIFAYALKDFFVPVSIACEARPPFATPGVEYVEPSAASLMRAAAVLDVSIGGPDSALALAGGGWPLAVTTCSGAGEYLTGATPYEPWNWRSIHSAALRALGGLPVRATGALPSALEATQALAAARAAIPTDGPLVSVIMPTYNRRRLLERALESVARQQYASIEVVVVNDAGESVEDVVSQFPKARLIENPTNLGVVLATNVALAAARGEYIAFCCDDDMIYPDAIGRWVGALSRSPGRIVHGNTVMRFDRSDGAGGVVTDGYRLIWKESVDHHDSLFTPHTSVASSMLHREVLERLGPYEDTPVADIDWLLRMSRHYDFVHVDQPCIELEYDASKGQGAKVLATSMADALEAVYARYPSDSADVAAGRQRTLDWYAKRGEKGYYFEPDLTLAQPERR